MKPLIKTIVLFLCIAVGVLFGMLNVQSVVVDIYWVQFEMPLAIAVATALFLGLAFGMLSGWIGTFHLKRTLKRIKAQLAVYEKDIVTQSET